MDSQNTYQEKRFSECCEELRCLYQQELQCLRSKCEDFLKQHSFLQSESVLSVIKKEKHENYHSLLIKYVWEHENGGEILTDFLEAVGVEGAWLESVGKRQYRVEEEHTIMNQRCRSWNGKRIDLLVCDDVNKWLVAIENKVMSSVRYSTATKTQLDIYRGYCENKKDWVGYSKVYILLDYKGSCQDDKWMSANYIDVFSSILRKRPKNRVVDDYLRTLYILLSPIENPQTLAEVRMFNKEIIEKI